MIKYIIPLFLILFCLNIYPAHSQNIQTKIEALFEKLVNPPGTGNEALKQRVKSLEDQIETALKNNDNDKITTCYYDLAWAYFYIADFDNALKNFIATTQYKGDLYYRINAYGIASNIFSWTNRNKEALEYAHEGLLLAEETKDNALIGYAMLYLGDAHNYSGDIVLAKDNYIIATEYFTKARDEGNIQIPTSTALLQLVNLDIDTRSALEYAFMVKYMYDNGTRDDKQIFSLSLFKSLQSFMKLRVVERQREQRIWLYSVGAILLIVIAFFLLLQNLSRKKMNMRLQLLNTQLAEQNNTKVKILGILNHDLRQPIAQWVNFLELRKRAPEDITPEMENRSLNKSLNLLYNVEELLIWSKDQMYRSTGIDADISISDLFDNIKTFFRYENNITFIFRNPDNITIKTQRDHLIIIMRNLTSNAINALRDEEKPVIEWTATTEYDNITLYIRDNGCGIFTKDPSKSKDWTDISPANGLGLQIIQDIAQKINCTIQVKQDQEKGTIFKLIFDRKSI